MRHASTIAVVLCLGLTAAANGQKKADPPPATAATAAKIASARSAAPAAISANATIAEMGPGGKMTTLVMPDVKQLDSYSSTPSASTPYVMWKGTPYAHLMVPVKP